MFKNIRAGQFKVVTPWGKYQKGKRRAKKKKKAGTLYADQDFSGSPTSTPVDMFNQPAPTPSTLRSLRQRRKSFKRDII